MYSSEERFDRTISLIGKDAFSRLQNASVAVFGIGGVGGYAAEALVRSGVGSLLLVDFDTVSVSNINRQIIATQQTVGQKKTEAFAKRAREINPDVQIKETTEFIDSENIEDILKQNKIDYIIDAIDTVSAKVELIAMAKDAGVPIISAMGAGGKLDPTAFRVADISKTEICPLARAVRLALRKRGISKVKVVYSTELPVTDNGTDAAKADGKRAPGSVSFVPSVMGLIIAGEVIKEIAGG